VMKGPRAILRNLLSHKETVPSLEVKKIATYATYRHLAAEQQNRTREIALMEQRLVSAEVKEFTVDGTCYVCQKRVPFLVDFKYAGKGASIPNWRERLECPGCRLNSRMRATVQIFQQECKPTSASRIFITEQLTPAYSWFVKRYANIVGSEYLGDLLPYGEHNQKGIRNEDLTNLSFRENEFDFILSFDVLEHVPDYRKALHECCRCLKPSGILYFSVPFIKTSEEHLVRAHRDEAGKVNHVLPPEYHGDPLNADGCLCYRHFGWKLLDELRDAGFVEANALLYWSRELGYLGGEQILFKARK